MEHFYQNIDGWFDFSHLYEMFVHKMQNGSTIAEIGVWKGKSISYLGVLVKNSNKDIKIYAVDTWGKLETEKYHSDGCFLDDNLYKEFIKNIEPLSDVVIPCRGTSLEICQTFPNNYFDIVFIDACHDYECAYSDIINWLPKVKTNGIIAGHDIGFPGVSKAIAEILKPKYNINVKGEAWWVQL